MARVIVSHAGHETTLDVPAGENVMQIARASGLPVPGDCNGSMACATCHVIVDSGWAARLPAPSDDEESVLDALFNLTATSRLACQIRPDTSLDGLRLALPA